MTKKQEKKKCPHCGAMKIGIDEHIATVHHIKKADQNKT